MADNYDILDFGERNTYSLDPMLKGGKDIILDGAYAPSGAFIELCKGDAQILAGFVGPCKEASCE